MAGKLPEVIKGGQFWHVWYEQRPTVIEIIPDGTGFYAFGQDAIWGFGAISEWISEIDIAHVEYGEHVHEGSYCLSCGSCGETGCCKPTKCMAVVCKYGESNIKDYETIQKQWDIMNTELLVVHFNKDKTVEELSKRAGEALDKVNKLFE